MSIDPIQIFKDTLAKLQAARKQEGRDQLTLHQKRVKAFLPIVEATQALHNAGALPPPGWKYILTDLELHIQADRFYGIKLTPSTDYKNVRIVFRKDMGMTSAYLSAPEAIRRLSEWCAWAKNARETEDRDTFGK